MPPFSELIAATTRTACHQETRDAYTPDDPAFLDWKAGKPVSAPAGADWYDLVREQLAYLLETMMLPTVSLGVIPFGTAGRPVWPLEAFTVFDDSRVNVELLSAQVTVTVPSEIVLYVRAFERLSGVAVYGDEARARITQAIDTL